MGADFAQQRFLFVILIFKNKEFKTTDRKIIAEMTGVPLEGTVHLHMEPSRSEQGHMLRLSSWLHEERVCVMYLISASEVEMCR